MTVDQGGASHILREWLGYICRKNLGSLNGYPVSLSVSNLLCPEDGDRTVVGFGTNPVVNVPGNRKRVLLHGSTLSDEHRTPIVETIGKTIVTL